MENAQLIGLSRQRGLERQMSVVANNIANINTTGFKVETLLFEEYEVPVTSTDGFSTQTEVLSYTQDWATLHDFSAGAITQTGNELDVALQGDGFLVVQTPAGEQWTRAGALQLDSTGLLVDLNGNPVMSEAGEIRFGPFETNIQFTEDGSIITSAGAKGRLKIVEFEADQALVRAGNNLFSGGEPVASTSTRVVQGAIERSNVSGVEQVAEMIRVTRSYQSIAKFLERQDELRQAAIQELGTATG